MKDPFHIFKLRMPRDLLTRVGEQAKQSRRSRTQEVLIAVEAHLAQGDQTSRPSGGAPAAGEPARV